MKKNMNMSMKMLNSFNTCFFRLKFYFLGKFMILGEKCGFTISESNIRKKSKISPKGCFMGQKVAYKISGQYINK